MSKSKFGPALFLCLLAGCVGVSRSEVGTFPTDSDIQYVSKGWTDVERQAWYAATQGSRLMPSKWLTSLERAEDDKPFLASDHMASFRFLPDEGNPQNPFPIGLAVDIQPDKNFDKTRLRWFRGQGIRQPWVGLNCAACHTTEITYQDKRVRVDGGSSLLDLQRFEEAVNAAIEVTSLDSEKFDRFAKKVLGSKDNEKNRKKLNNALERLLKWQKTTHRMNATSMRYGFARTDAFGHIFNRVALFTGAEDPKPSPSDAPVSYPFIWNAPQHDLVQWNGMADNEKIQIGPNHVDIGALGRNAGEVVGVFGEVVPNVKSATISKLIPSVERTFYSSAFIDNLEKMEKLVGKLNSPKWPEETFGILDQSKVDRGAALFVSKECSACHKPLRSDDLSTPVQAQMSYFQPVDGQHSAPNTDPAMACRAYDKMAMAGTLKDLKFDDENGTAQKVREKENVAALVKIMVKGAIFDQDNELIQTASSVVSGARRNLVVHNPGNYPRESAFKNLFRTVGMLFKSVFSGAHNRRLKAMENANFTAPAPTPLAPVQATPLTRDWGEFNDCMSGPPSKLKGYKARPLNGIWATAPYLHNGSVPNLYELLLAPEDRSAKFYVGTKEYDPKKVGYRTNQSQENIFLFRTRDDNNEIIWGNYNGGHDYGNGSFTESEREDLVEYMKSL